MTTFRILAREVSPTQRVLQVHGEFGLADVDRLQEALDEMPSGIRRTVIDLEGCEFIDSIALAALLRARDRLAESDCRLALSGANGQVQRILEVSGLDIDGFLFADADEALAAAD